MAQSQPSPPNNLFHPLRIPVSFHQAPIQRSPSMNEQLQTLEHARQTVIDLAIQFGPKLVVALLILAAGYYVGRWVGRLADSMLEKLGLDETLRQLLVRIVRILALGLFFIMVLQNLGVQLLPPIAGLGVAGADIALAMQGVAGHSGGGADSYPRPARSASQDPAGVGADDPRADAGGLQRTDCHPPVGPGGGFLYHIGRHHPRGAGNLPRARHHASPSRSAKCACLARHEARRTHRFPRTECGLLGPAGGGIAPRSVDRTAERTAHPDARRQAQPGQPAQAEAGLSPVPLHRAAAEGSAEPAGKL